VFYCWRGWTSAAKIERRSRWLAITFHRWHATAACAIQEQADSMNSSPAKEFADSPVKDPTKALAASRRKNKMLQMMLDSAQAELEELRNSDDLNRTV